MAQTAFSVVLDSSAIVAILIQDQGWEKLLSKAVVANVIVGSPTVLEASIVMTVKTGNDGLRLVRDLLRELDATEIEFGEAHASRALDAFLRYGKGRHEASLNFGDCTAYAIAIVADLPLLFVGNDFAKTDVRRA